MIQDIYPSKLHNEYRNLTIGSEDTPRGTTVPVARPVARLFLGDFVIITHLQKGDFVIFCI